MDVTKDIKNRLTERMVRNDEIFCSLLFDSVNRTLRVVDFRGGNFQSKHEYLEHVLMTESMRKIFTLIERDDMSGWQRMGYRREGAIPGYYKRSDAYIMSRIYDADMDLEPEVGEESEENKKLLVDIKTAAKELSEQKPVSWKVEQITETEVVEIINTEITRSAPKNKSKTSKSKKKEQKLLSQPTVPNTVFAQFSREVEYYYYSIQNRRTKQCNILGAEYQDCFGNAKVHLYFDANSKAEQNLALNGLLTAIDKLVEIGAVSIFSLTRSDDFASNTIYAAAGFRNTGWMSRQLLIDRKTVDQILWTKKLI